MKKYIIVALTAVLCVSCRARSVSKPTEIYTEPQYVANGQYNPSYVNEGNLYSQNITVKAMGEDFVVYEYSDAKVDKVASLAINFCNETNPGKKAYLRDIYMHKNHKRRATFDCVDLATM
ncbi:MAG: hypothetical protein IJ525_06085 [Alphaproteobacteria bacterium]|nr:hypothetical protein [Alphaproteobacteria bacterium]MBR3501903.1 hypothetical protein [Alphaproteobacteria bacterium]